MMNVSSKNSLLAISFFLFSSLTLFSMAQAAEPAAVAAAENCECPKLACDSCSRQTDITFYSSKCGVNLAKVKSCARPTCVPIEETTKECPVLPNSTAIREPIVVKAVSVVNEAETAPTEVGKVRVLKGSVSIVHADGSTTSSSNDVQLKERDRVAVNDDGGAIVEFNGGNRLHVHSKTEVEVKEYSRNSDDTKKVLLNLIRGKVRSQVKEKYNGQTSYYKITTKAAVAGVRGTDFVIDQTGDVTRVETLEGKVAFGDAKGIDSVMVAKGTGVTLEQGQLKPVYQINAERMKKLNQESDLESSLRMAKNDDRVCKNPAGAFNKCAWRCLNNPEGEGKCRVDLPKVVCQRVRCNANGQWAEATDLPSTHSEYCPATGAKVKDCDY